MNIKEFDERLIKLQNEIKYVKKQQKQIEKYNAELRRRNNRLRIVNVFLKIRLCFKIILHIGAMKNRYEDYSINRVLTFWQVYFFMYAFCLMKENGYLTKKTIKTS